MTDRETDKRVGAAWKAFRAQRLRDMENGSVF